MKTRKIIFILMLAVFMVSLSSCSLIIHAIRHPAGKLAMDPDLSADQTAVVIFGEPLFIKEYNGIDVKSKWYPKDRTRKMTITLPAGEAHLLFDIYAAWDRGNTTYHFRPKDVELKFNFEAGKQYTVALYAGKNEGNFFFPRQKIYLAVWNRIYSDADPGNREENNILKSWELGEF